MTTYPHPIRTEWKLLTMLRRDNPGITQGEAARQLGVSALTIKHWTDKPLYQSYESWFLSQTYDNLPLQVKRRQAEVKEEIDEFAQEMLVRLKDIIETTSDEKLIASIGMDMLDRAGYSEPKRDVQRNIQVVLTPEVLAILQRRAAEIIDVEPVQLGEAVG